MISYTVQTAAHFCTLSAAGQCKISPVQLANSPVTFLHPAVPQPKSLDTAFQRRIRFELQFAMPPPSLRAKLWRLMLPEQVGMQLAQCMCSMNCAGIVIIRR